MNSVEAYDKPQDQRRLTRSPHGMIAGVCAGLSDCYGINLIFIRLFFVVLGLAQGVGLILYLILALVIPAAPQPNATGSAATCAPRSPIPTFFTCIAGVVSVCATALAMMSDASSILHVIEKVMVLMEGY
jgi:phage shock protein PspC (stress-responsive transcriptional regulator)